MRQKTPCIIVNFKAYPQAIGSRAVSLGKICSGVANSKKVSIALCVQPTDLYRVSSCGLPVFSQHVDSAGLGAHTGWLAVDGVLLSGGCGSLVNHSEHRLSYVDIVLRVKALKKAGLISIVCASTLAQVKKLSLLRPDFIAYEPASLIGGKVSVSDAKPGVISSCVRAVGKKSQLLVGAGVHSSHDVAVALELGAVGVLVASGVVKAKNPRKALLDLVSGLKK